MKSKKNSVVPFNKKNVLAFADTIFSDKGGVVTLLKLCNGVLSDGKDGGRTLHCAVGEAYFQFVSNDMKPVLKAKGEPDEHGHRSYESKYGSVQEDGPTAAAIDALVDAAHLKNSKKKELLAEALSDAVSANDEETDDDDMGFYLRSKEVAEVFRKKVAPLLK